MWETNKIIQKIITYVPLKVLLNYSKRKSLKKVESFSENGFSVMEEMKYWA